MAERRSTMMYPAIEDLLVQVDSKFTLVTLAARRARQINSYFSQLGDGLGALVPPQVASVARKPLSIALEEVAAAKIGYRRPETDEDGDELEVGEGSPANGATVLAELADVGRGGGDAGGAGPADEPGIA